MERLVMLSPKAVTEDFSGQRQVIVSKLRQLNAGRKPIALSTLASQIRPRELKLVKGRSPEGAINYHIRALAKAKLLRVHRVYGRRPGMLFAVNPARINEKLRAKLANPKKNSHGLVVLRYLLAAKEPQDAASIIEGVRRTGKYKTHGSSDSLILGDLRIWHDAGVVAVHRTPFVAAIRAGARKPPASVRRAKAA